MPIRKAATHESLVMAGNGYTAVASTAQGQRVSFIPGSMVAARSLEPLRRRSNSLCDTDCVRVSAPPLLRGE